MLLVMSCATQAPAPIEQKSRTTSTPKPAIKAKQMPVKAPLKGDTYRVQAGDTLYSIAWRLGVDFRELAQLNRIQDPSRIVVGQVIRIGAPNVNTRSAPVAVLPRAATSGGGRVASPASTTVDTTSARTLAPIPKTVAKVPSGTSPLNPQWIWPADGKANRSVSATGSIGLEIRGTRGQTIRAAGGGQVVYGGSGLRGYGQLLIIKHDERFLSAYAHNDKLLVAEGQRIERGQPIALMGDSGASEVMLHFEIRKGGKAVEPLQYLPKR